MKVLFFRYRSICEPDIIDAFMELGLEVIEFGIDIEDKSLVSKEIINKLSKKLMDNPVDIVFSINFWVIKLLEGLPKLLRVNHEGLMNLKA